MKRVQHDEVKPGMVIKLAHHGGAHGRWVTIEHIYGYKLSTPKREAAADVRAYYTNAQKRERFGLQLFAQKEGYELHPQSALLAAQEVQRRGRADRMNVVLREYSIKLHVVDRVDNQGVPCGYCSGANMITSNIYATVFNESNCGRTEESAWSTCATCEIYSIDQVEDVDPAHTVTIERAKL